MADSVNELLVDQSSGRSPLTRLIVIFRSIQQILHRILEIILTIVNPLVMLFAFIREVCQYSYTTLQNCLAYIHAMFHFNYKSSAEAVLETPKTFYHKMRMEARERLWVPLDRWLRFIARLLWIQLRTLRVYCRGFAELSRRLFLLTSDYTPGGKWTVGIFLGVVSYMLVTRMLTYVGTLLGILKFLSNTALFILDPIVFTLKDVFSVVKYLLSIILAIFCRAFSLLCSAVEKVLYFFGINVAAILSGVYKCWRVFITSKPVQLISTATLSALYSSLDFTVFSILPFLSRVMLYVSTKAVEVSTFAYSKLAVVNAENYSGELYSVTSVASAVLTLYALWITFHFRNAFPPTLYVVVEGYESVKATKTSPATVAIHIQNRAAGKVKKSQARDDNTEVYIRTSSSDPICSSFLLGNCKRGRLCDRHHCHASYHWQYRSNRGWKSFSDDENHVIERLYCDPASDVVKTSDVKMALTSYTAKHTPPAQELVKLDFENMKAEKDYRTADLRRLSTESYVKASENTMATRWVWYYQDDGKIWRKYEDENQNENGRTQEDIEAAFIRRERYHTLNRDGMEYRLHFYMKPMCERSASYRDNSRRAVRRRPTAVEEKPAEPEKKAGLSFWQKWSPLRVFAWR